MTIDTLKEILSNNYKSKKLIEKCLNYTANVRGNASYWHSVKGSLQNIIEQKGTPNIFFTFSSAEPYWADLAKLFTTDLPTDWCKRMLSLQNYTSLIDWFFMKRFASFIKVLFHKIYPSEWYWYRIEFQHRGTIHIHGFSRVILTFNLEQTVNSLLKANSFNKNGILDTQGFKTWKYNEQKIIDTIDKFVTTAWPWPADTNVTEPLEANIHPCSILLSQLSMKSLESYYSDLSTKCCRHTKCSKSYCLKRKRGIEKCRFGFPKPVTEQTTLIYNKNHSNNDYLTYNIQRKDSLINTHNIYQILGWKANVDIQFILSESHVVEYLTKYVTKTEPTSLGLKSYIEKLIESNEDRTVTNLFKSSILKVLAGRDIGLMECSHILQGLPLYKSSLEFLTINLFESRELNTQATNNNEITKKKLTDFYRSRNINVSHLNLYEFTLRYFVKNDKLVKRKTDVRNKVIKFVPNYIYTKGSSQYFKYCLLQLIKFKPWVGFTYKLKETYSEVEKQAIIAEWEDFTHENPKFINFGKYDSNLGYVDDYDEQYLDEPTNNQNEEDLFSLLHDIVGMPGVEYEDKEERIYNLLYQRAHTQTNEITQVINQYLLNKYRHILENNINSHSQTLNDDILLDTDHITTFTTKQKDIFKYFENDLKKKSRTLAIIYGSAGTGKTFLIKPLQLLLGEKLVVCATTGIAAVNIGNDVTTLHKLFKLPISTDKETQLRGNTLKSLQTEMKIRKYLLIDEFSMLSSYDLYWLDLRLKTIMVTDQIFSGISVILCGDIFQLPPVKGMPLYAKNATRFEDIVGHGLYLEFDQVFILDKIMRQQSETSKRFVEILERLRFGKPTEQDWEYLKNNFISHENLEDLTNCIKLFSTNSETKLYNYQRLMQSNDKLYYSRAIDSHHSMMNVQRNLLGNLDFVVFLSLNSPVYLTYNYNVEMGLANGSMGILREVIFCQYEGEYIPDVLLIEFEKKKLLPTEPELVPIQKITVQHDYDYRKNRTQFPIKSAYALTIHKSQGMTLQRAVIDIGKREFCPGLSYVALSRITDFGNLGICPFSLERFMKIGENPQVKARVSEHNRLEEIHSTK